jgi:hypothetical protein
VATPTALAATSSTPSTRPGPQTCADYLALPVEDRIVLYGGDDVAEFTSSGAKKYSPSQLVTRWCQSQSPEALLIGISDPRKLAGSDPKCSDFLELSASAQQSWISVGAEVDGWDNPIDRETAVMACELDPKGVMHGDDASFTWRDWDGRQATWATESKLGYLKVLVLTTQALNNDSDVRYNPFDPNGQAPVGEACGYDPEHDALIPLLVTVTNLTQEDATLDGSYALVYTGAGSAVTTAYLETRFTTGVHCSNAATSSTASRYGAVLTWSWSDTTSAGGEKTHKAYVIIKDYYSPRYPDGAVNELASYQIRGLAAPDDSDPQKMVHAIPLTLSAKPA